VLAIGLQCAEALEALHAVGLAHTALTPASAALVLVERNAMPALQRAMGDRAPIVCRIAQGSTIIG